jgi:hypothetical protein
MIDGYIRKVLPDPSLKGYIRQYTFIDIPLEKTKQVDFKVMPSGHARMILFLGEPSLHEVKNTLQPVDRCSLTGLVSRPIVFVPRSYLQQVMIHTFIQSHT